MTDQRTAEVLAELVEKVPDRDMLETLLEPNNLILLARRQGRSLSEVRSALAGDNLSGELLLDILKKEPDPNKLMAQINGTAPEEAPAPERRAVEATPAKEAPARRETSRKPSTPPASETGSTPSTEEPHGGKVAHVDTQLKKEAPTLGSRLPLVLILGTFVASVWGGLLAYLSINISPWLAVAGSLLTGVLIVLAILLPFRRLRAATFGGLILWGVLFQVIAILIATLVPLTLTGLAGTDGDISLWRAFLDAVPVLNSELRSFGPTLLIAIFTAVSFIFGVAWRFRALNAKGKIGA